jgi:hypothetical protein
MKIKNIFFEKKLLYCVATGTVDKIRGAREKYLSLPKKNLERIFLSPAPSPQFRAEP